MLSGVDAEKVGADAANELLRNIDEGGCVDDYLQDQVITASVYCIRRYISLQPALSAVSCDSK